MVQRNGNMVLQGDDTVFGTIHPRQTVIAFTLRGHWRVTLAILLLAVGSSALLGGYISHSLARLPVPQKSVQVARVRRAPVSTPKTSRVWMPGMADGPPKLDLIERMGDGSMVHSAYFDVSVGANDDLEAPKSRVPAMLNSYQESEAADHPFGLVLQPDLPAHRLDALVRKSQRLGQVHGEPINVSIAPVRPAPLVRHLVSVPAQEEPLGTIRGALNVPDAEFQRLGEELGARSVKPGEELDLLVSEGAGEARPLQIVFARHRTQKGKERLLARRDDGRFQEVADRHLYDRMTAEALSADKASPQPSSQARPEDDRALARARSDYPKLMTHLAASKVPSRVSLQVADLLRDNDIEWSQRDGEPVIDLVFRKAEDGREELVSVTIHKDGKEQRFYRYSASDDGKPEYFDDKGRSMSKKLMHKPVQAGQLGDGFGWRVHPILNVRKFHNGVDYRAPKGSPIVAAGDGVVVTISSESGYGKYIRIRHDGGYTTTYAHIAGTPKGLAVGQRVSQGQVIAFVGSTGLSTGPHLYYELRVGDKYADPTKAEMPAGTSLHGPALNKFQAQMGRVEAIAQAIKNSATSAAEAVAHALKPSGSGSAE